MKNENVHMQALHHKNRCCFSPNSAL